jgi:heptosyltransferase-1
MTRYVDRSRASDGISSQYLLLARELGLDTKDFSMNVALNPEAQIFSEKFAASLSTPYAVLAPFTTRPQKHWIEGRWQLLLEALDKELDLGVVVLGGPDDIEASARILPEEGPRRVNLTGKTSLQEAAAVIEKAALLVGVDTGLTHMSIALKTPTIALFGATLPYRDTRGTSGTVLYHKHECSPCRRNPTCEMDFTCMKAITTAEVMKAAQALLEVP